MVLAVQFRKGDALRHEQVCINRHFSGPKRVKYISAFDRSVNFNEPESLLNGMKGIILGGSSELFLGNLCGTRLAAEEETEVLRTIEPLLKFLLEKDTPTLGICFGHQLLAHFLGSRVISEKKRSEVGCYRITLTQAGVIDTLFAGFPQRFFAVLGHNDSVESLPFGTTHLAYSKRCPIQGFRHGKNVYGLQFHAEMDDKDLQERVALLPQYEISSNTSVDEHLKKTTHAKKAVAAFLRKFQNKKEK